MRRRTVLAYKRTFESPEGKLVLQDMVRCCPFLRSSIDSRSVIDVNKLLLLEGQRSVLLRIFQILNRDPNDPRLLEGES